VTTSERGRRELHALARSKGIEVRWRTQQGDVRTCSDDTLMATLRMLGVEVASPAAARRARLELSAAERADPVDPVVVAWDGTAPSFEVRAPGPFVVSVEHEDGSVATWRDSECRMRGGKVTLPRGFRTGRYRLHVEGRRWASMATLLAAPARLGRANLRRAWGVFAPVYALHEREQTTTGDVATLGRLAAWAGGRGARVVGTLPMLATFLGHGNEPCDPSPYMPVSRRFWNEVYLDLGDEARHLEPSPGARVDLPALAAARRPLLERLANKRPVDATPDVRAYAQFRAAREGSGEQGERVHAYAQMLMARQLEQLARDLARRDQMLYLDMPVGAHRDGFDVVHGGDLFIRDASVGAPPDDFHGDGQNWGFPPVHPDVARRDGFAYLASCLDAQLRYARALRFDHVMGLHRLWMITPGASAADGAYVHYESEAQWAVVCIEAARHDAAIVGEDLGTVPAETDRAIRRHRALGMWVAQFEKAANPPSTGRLACLDTHDLPTFASWWRDLDERARRALVDAVDAPSTAPDQVLSALLAWLGRSRSPVVLVQLEDLWLETEPQNRPAGAGEPSESAANFRRRMRYGIDELDALDEVKQVLHRLDRARKSR
jgi:4-alpha-glucanotransferase